MSFWKKGNIVGAFEDQYIDVLQNIEMSILSVYREHDDLLDYDVDKVLNILWTEYRNERTGKEMPLPVLNPNARLIYDRVKEMCQWRLGRTDILSNNKAARIKPEAITVDEIMDCLKRIRKSVALWTKEGGRQGYLYFIDNNID
jgi:hypothetical protein